MFGKTIISFNYVVSSKKAKMPRVNTIITENKVIEEKLNYFIDSYNDIITHIGLFEEYQIETPNAILDKILFQLKHNDQYRLYILDNYLKSTLINNEELLKSFKAYTKVKEQIDEYNRTDNKEKKKQIADSATFQRNLFELKKELDHNLLTTLIDNIVKLIGCDHRLSDSNHSEAIRYNTQLIVSILFLSGRKRNEVRDILHNIFSKNADNFPYPDNIKTIRQKEKYLESCTIEDQIRSLQKAALKKPYNANVLLKIYGGALPNKYTYKYNNVTFISADNIKLDKIKRQLDPIYSEFFLKKGNYFIAQVNVNYYSIESMYSNAKEAIKNELIFLKAVLHRDFSIDSGQNYICIDKNYKLLGSGVSSVSHNSIISEYELKTLNKSIYEEFRHIKSEAVDWILSLEYLYINAAIHKNIAGLWQYLESMLSKNKSQGNIQVSNIVANIIIIDEIADRRSYIIFKLKNILSPINSGFELLGYGNSYKSVHKGLSKGIIYTKLRKIEYPFIKEQILYHDKAYSKKDYLDIVAYYKSILVEAYEFRNATVHSGQSNYHSYIKLNLTLLPIINRFRHKILQEIRKNPEMPFQLLIDSIVKEGKKLY